MNTDIRIDIEAYQCKHGKPVGRGFWTFRIVSPTATIRDHVFTTQTPMTYQAACQRAREIAALRRAELIVLVPEQ